MQSLRKGQLRRDRHQQTAKYARKGVAGPARLLTSSTVQTTFTTLRRGFRCNQTGELTTRPAPLRNQFHPLTHDEEVILNSPEKKAAPPPEMKTWKCQKCNCVVTEPTNPQRSCFNCGGRYVPAEP